MRYGFDSKPDGQEHWVAWRPIPPPDFPKTMDPSHLRKPALTFQIAVLSMAFLPWMAWAQPAPVATAAPAAMATAPAGRWDPVQLDKNSGTRHLTYSGTLSLLGKPVPVQLRFFCNPLVSKNENGALGFDFTVNEVAKLAPFRFADFEGPDARPGERLRLTLTRAGKPPLSLRQIPSGSFTGDNQFAFSVSDLSRDARSPSRLLLQALADGGELLEIVVTDTRKADLRLELAVPVAGRQADFKAMLVNLK